MPNLLLDLEIDAACWEFLAQRIVANGGAQPPQPIVALLDAGPDDEMPDEWDELTAKAARMSPAPDQQTFVERMLARMDE